MKREHFLLPEGLIYLDGNSLGPLPCKAADRVARTIEAEWGKLLIRGWNDAGWMQQPSRLGNRLGQLLGCPDGSVVLGDTLSIKVYQALSGALAMNPGRRIVLSDSGNFPTDLYMAEGLLKTLDRGHSLRLVAPDAIVDALGSDVAVLMLTQVDYRTGRLHDMDTVTQAAQELDIIVIWDLAHSAGALPIDLLRSQAEFAVGCTYKYLNGGPGAPAFIYTRPDIVDTVEPALAGWLGHASPFAFDLDYRPAAGIERMRVGTPPVIQLAALEAALDIWDEVSIDDVRSRSIELSELFIHEVEDRCPALGLVSPRDPAQRGSQVSFRHVDGYAIVQALARDGVIGDFRAPDVMRFGITPLYLGREDIVAAAMRLQKILDTSSWDRPEYRKRAAVT